MKIDYNELYKLYSPKQIEVVKAYFRLRPSKMINHGAVRSGKTIVDNDIFMFELARIARHIGISGDKEIQYILAGASLGNIEKNVLSELRKKYGIVTKFDKFNRFKLFGVNVCCVGHDDAGSVKAITGMTAYGCYINEAHLANKEAFDEIMKRISGDRDYHPIAIMDANPSAPNHFLKVDYIDKADGYSVYAMNWQLDDNTFLNANYVQDIKRDTPSGVFYDRKILGQWVSADGIVYADFDKVKHVIEELPNDVIRYFCGVDWGYEHYGCICLFGVRADGKGIVLIEEITARHQLIDWWVKKAQEIVKKYGYGIPFYCDSARPENIRELSASGIWALKARKEINAGVECVAKYIKTDRIKFYNRGLTRFMDEIYGYVWDSAKGVPIKQNDDVMDAVRYGVYCYDKTIGG